MVKKFLKIAGVKSEADFYKKYPSEGAFFKAHPEAKDLKQYKQGGQTKKLNQLTNWTNDVDNIIPKAQYGCKGKSCTQTGEGIKKKGVRDMSESQGDGDGTYVQLSNAPTTWEELLTYNETNPKDKDFKNRLKSLQGQFPGLTQQQMLAAGADSSRIRQRMGDLPRYDKPAEQTFDRAYHMFYRPLMDQKTPVTIPQILQFQSQQPGGLQGYEGTVRGNYNRPKAQTGLDLARSMRASSDNVAPRRNYEKEEQDKALNKKQALNEITTKQNANKSSVGKAKPSTPASEKARAMKNKQYASTRPYSSYDEQTGDVTRSQWDRSMEGAADRYTTAADIDKGMTHAQHAGEVAGLITGLGGAARAMLRNATKGKASESLALKLSDEEMEQAMREIEEANIDPSLLELDANPSSETLARRKEMKNLFKKLDEEEASKTFEDDLTKIKARAEFGPQDLESSAGKSSVNRKNISDLLGNIGKGGEDSGFQMYEQGQNLFNEYFPGYLDNVEPYTGTEAFSTIRPNRWGGVTRAQNGAPIGSYMSSPMQQNTMMNFSDYMNPADKMVTGSTQKERDDEAYRQATLAAKEKSSGGGGGMGNILGMASKAFGVGKNGLRRAQIGLNQPQNGSMPSNNNPYMYGSLQPLGGNQSITNLNQNPPMLDPNQTGTFDQQVAGSAGAVNPKKKFNPLGAIPIAGQIYGGIQQIKAAKNAEKEANKQFQLSGLTKQAGLTRGEPIKRKYVRPEDQVINQNEMFPTYGVGTNYIAEDGAQVTRGGIGGNETEIQNMYNPYNLFKDLGYEPLDDSEKVKQYQGGGLVSGSQFSQLGQGIGAMVGGNGQGTPGGWSQALGAIPGPIGMVGGIVGSVLDGRQQAKTKYFQDRAQKNVVDTAMQQGMQNVQSQYSNVMEDGGYVSHDWQPQVIASFGGHRLSHLLQRDPMMDTLRTGGHITQNEGDDMGPVISMAMGGEMKTHWGGYAEPMSYNPFLPEGGETVMFRGNSHDESDGKGNTGIGVTYGDNPVEVERGEPAVKLKDGGTGEDNMVVYGNLKIPNQYLSEIGDPKAKGRKFKNYVADLSKQEARHNKTVEKNMNIIDAMDDITSFDQMKFFSAKANIDGANMKLKNIAEKKMNAAAVQNAINEAAEESGLDADALAKGKFKLDKKAMDETAKWGKSIKNAQNGTRNKAGGEPELTYLPDGRLKFTSDDGSYYIVDKDKSRTMYDKSGNIVKVVGGKSQNIPAKHAMTVIPSIPVGPDDDGTAKSTYHYPVTPYKGSNVMNAYSQLIPYLRPTDQEALDPTQMYGEMYALATNQLDPVQAQLYRPLLDQPYDISLQDQLNANQADFNAIQRQTGYNPAAAATLAGQKYAANSKVLADQFRANQAMKADVFNRNRGTLNDAQLKNLAALDQQMVRQETAKSRTKEVGQAALNSISDKILKQKLANRTLSIYENMYNYRYDKSGRAVNMNPAFQANIPNVLPVYDDQGNVVAYQKGTTTDKSTLPPLPALPLPTGGKNGTKVSSRNRDIMRAMKNL
jgi:hypothetical protein